MIIESEVETLHEILIKKFGGSSGIRDKESLQSALNRPFQTFNQKELHASVINKAAALMESILANHPFVDGNKRTGYLAMRLYLIKNGYDIVATLNDKYEFVMNIAVGISKFNVILDWLNRNTKILNLP